MKKLKTLLLVILVFICSANSVYAEKVVTTSSGPDYDVWVANNMISTYRTYPTFRSLQAPIYKTLGEYILEDQPLAYLTATWSVFLNGEYRSQFMDEQKYIYEIILLDYLKYCADVKPSMIDIENSQFEFTKKLYTELAEYVGDNRYDVCGNVSVEDAEEVFKRLDNIENLSKALKVTGKVAKTAKYLIEESSRYLALRKAKDEAVMLLKASKNGSFARENRDYIKAVDDVISSINQASLNYKIGRTSAVCWNMIMDSAWDFICNKYPWMKAIDIGVTGLDACFDTTNAASNRLKLLYLYCVDCYMNQGLIDACGSYLNNRTHNNAVRFRSCFEGYLQFQMFGNTYAQTWLNDFRKGGFAKDFFNGYFNAQNMNTASDLLEHCRKQTNARSSLLKQVNQISDVYKAKYSICKEGAAKTTKPVYQKITSIWNETNGVRIKWPKSSNASGYKIYRKLNNGSWKDIGKITNRYTTSFLDKTAENGKFYTYIVKGYIGNKISDYDKKGLSIVRLRKPKEISECVSNEPGKVYLKWSKNEAASGAKIDCSTDKNFKNMKAISKNGNGNAGTVTGLIGGNVYYFRVRTCKKVNGITYYSPYSGVKSVKVKKNTANSSDITKRINDGMSLEQAAKVLGLSFWYEDPVEYITCYRSTAKGIILSGNYGDRSKGRWDLSTQTSKTSICGIKVGMNSSAAISKVKSNGWVKYKQNSYPWGSMYSFRNGRYNLHMRIEKSKVTYIGYNPKSYHD